MLSIQKTGASNTSDFSKVFKKEYCLSLYGFSKANPKQAHNKQCVNQSLRSVRFYVKIHIKITFNKLYSGIRFKFKI